MMRLPVSARVAVAPHMYSAAGPGGVAGRRILASHGRFLTADAASPLAVAMSVGGRCMQSVSVSSSVNLNSLRHVLKRTSMTQT